MEVSNDRIHCIPLDDWKEHVALLTCWCHPEDDDDVVVHHSMDRREEYEEGRLMS